MRSKLKRLIAGLAMTGAMALPAVALASPAQAAPPAPVTKCSAPVQAGSTGLKMTTCYARDGVNVWGWTTVQNSGNAQYYLAELDVKMHFSLNFTVCPINAWIPPGQSKTCVTPSYVTNAPTYAVGYANYWNGSQYVWLNVNSPT